MGRADYGGAEAALRAALAAAPESVEAHSLLAVALFHEQRPKESLAEYTQAAKFRTPGPEDLIGVASDYILLEDYPDANRWLTQVTERAPQLAQGWYLLGRTQYNENRPFLAEQSFLTCLRLEPRHLRAEYNLGLVYEHTQRTDEAIAAYKTAIGWQAEARVKDPQPMLDLGMLLRQQGHVAEAVPYLTAATQAGPHNPLAHQELGLAYDQLGRADDAVAQLQQAVALAPGTLSLHFFLGRVYKKAGRANEAAKEFAEAVRLSAAKSSSGTANRDVVPEPPK